MKFFFDTSISSRLVRALKILVEHQNLEIVHLNDIFDQSSVPDIEWITKLGNEGEWIIISADPRISRNRIERAAWKESGLTAFFFADGWSSHSIYEQGADLIRRWPDIIIQSRQYPNKTGFLITKAKDFQIIFD